MKTALNFVRGAVASTGNITPVLTRFCIADGRIQGTNGRVAIDSVCEELAGISALVEADRFLSAVDACDGDPVISMTENGRLQLSRAGFKARLPVQPPELFPRSAPTPGKPVKLTERFMAILHQMRPFIGEDSTRQWCLTLFSNGDRAFATNSNMIACCPANKLKFQLPCFAVDELIRIGITPHSYTADEGSVTFEYGDMWMRSQLVTGEWPVKTAEDLLSWTHKLPDIPEKLIDEIASILPFCADLKNPEVYFTATGISTTPGETQAEVDGAGWPPMAFDARNLLPMLRASQRFMIEPEKGRGLFEGEGGFRGVMAGRKNAS